MSLVAMGAQARSSVLPAAMPLYLSRRFCQVPSPCQTLFAGPDKRLGVVTSLLVGRRACVTLAAIAQAPVSLLPAATPLCVSKRCCRIPSPCLTFIAGPDKRPVIITLYFLHTQH